MYGKTKKSISLEKYVINFTYSLQENCGSQVNRGWYSYALLTFAFFLNEKSKSMSVRGKVMATKSEPFHCHYGIKIWNWQQHLSKCANIGVTPVGLSKRSKAKIQKNAKWWVNFVAENGVIFAEICFGNYKPFQTKRLPLFK